MLTSGASYATINTLSGSDEAEPLLGRLGSAERVAKPTARSVYCFCKEVVAISERQNNLSNNCIKILDRKEVVER